MEQQLKLWFIINWYIGRFNVIKLTNTDDIIEKKDNNKNLSDNQEEDYSQINSGNEILNEREFKKRKIFN